MSGRRINARPSWRRRNGRMEFVANNDDDQGEEIEYRYEQEPDMDSSSSGSSSDDDDDLELPDHTGAPAPPRATTTAAAARAPAQTHPIGTNGLVMTADIIKVYIRTVVEDVARLPMGSPDMFDREALFLALQRELADDLSGQKGLLLGLIEEEVSHRGTREVVHNTLARWARGTADPAFGTRMHSHGFDDDEPNHNNRNHDIGPPPQGGWSCPVCTLINPGTVTKCTLCDAPRPAASFRHAHERNQLQQPQPPQPPPPAQAQAQPAAHYPPQVQQPPVAQQPQWGAPPPAKHVIPPPPKKADSEPSPTKSAQHHHHKKKKEPEPDDLCIICLCSPRSHVVVPCGHMCLCDVCGSKQSAFKNKCPVCRGAIMSIIRVYE